MPKVQVSKLNNWIDSVEHGTHTWASVLRHKRDPGFSVCLSKCHSMWVRFARLGVEV